MNCYQLKGVVGEGTYGIVFKAIEKSTGEFVAIKQFKSSADEQITKREMEISSMLSHPNIVTFHASFRYNNLIHLVFEYVNDNLANFIHKNKSGTCLKVVKWIIYQICIALYYCHSNKTIHRDIKPENILIDSNGTVKLCDFGVARMIQMDGDALTDYIATRWYRAPEQELRLTQYSFSADMWSVGCIFSELITGSPLFPGTNQIDQIVLIQEALGPLPHHLLTNSNVSIKSLIPKKVNMNKTSYEAKNKIESTIFSTKIFDGKINDQTAINFIQNTLCLDPRDRITAENALKHPFLKSVYDSNLIPNNNLIKYSSKENNAYDNEEIEDIEEIINDKSIKKYESQQETKEYNTIKEIEFIEEEIEENIVLKTSLNIKRNMSSCIYDEDFEINE